MFIRPIDIAKLIFELTKKVTRVDELRDEILKIINYLENEKIEQLKSEFNIEC